MLMFDMDDDLCECFKPLLSQSKLNVPLVGTAPRLTDKYRKHNHTNYRDANGTGRRCTNRVIQIVTGKMAIG